MGKSAPFSTKLHDIARIALSAKLRAAKSSKTSAGIRVADLESAKSESVRVTLERVKAKKMERLEEKNHLPLPHVVSDCVKRWFQETLKEAKAGDTGMQVLVGQMYYRLTVAMVFLETLKRGMLGLVVPPKVEHQLGKCATNVQVITQVILVQMKQREELNKFKLTPTHVLMQQSRARAVPIG